MCGITGIVGQGSPVERGRRVAEMTKALAHRGPDGEGISQHEGVTLGHRRLAIIDPATGKQPLSNEDGTVWLTYNGEIYNFRELRSQLVSRGHHFRTQSDSEVIVHAWEEWGPSCVERFRGMFAFALVDLNTRRLMIARDHLGIKPLCYHVADGTIAFASELPALLKAFPTTPPVNPQAIEFFLRYRYIPAPDTGYIGVRKLPPATYHVYSLAGELLEERVYWKLSFEDSSPQTPDAAQEEFEQALQESVQAHLVSDVPFGAFLSGGVDSTLVVACMAKMLGKDVQAFTIDFEESQYSERQFAIKAAKRLGIRLHHEVVRPDVVGTLEKLFTNYGEPFGDTSAVPTWWVAELARRQVPMVLSGDGADEAFAGYGRYARWMNDSLLSDLTSFAKYPKRLTQRITEAFQRKFTNLRRHRWEERFVGVLSRTQRQRLWRKGHRHLVDTACPAFASAANYAAGVDKLSWAQHVDIQTYLPGDILNKVDIASMQHGLEVRTPFTDVRMFELAAKLPAELRFAHRDRAAGRLKAIPKRSLEQTFSNEFVNRKKMGFAIPEAAWMQKGNPVRSCFDDLLASNNSPIYEFLDQNVTEQLAREFDQRGVHATSLWSIFALSYWLNGLTSQVSQRKAA